MNRRYGGDTTTVRIPRRVHRAMKVVASFRDDTILRLATTFVVRGLEEEVADDPQLKEAIFMILNNKGEEECL